MSAPTVSRQNLAVLFGRAAKVFFVISYVLGFPLTATDPRAEGMAIFGLMALFCWICSHTYRAKRG